MTAEQVFSLCNLIALVSWLVLIVAGRVKWVASLATGAIVPLVLAGVYAVLIAAHWGERRGGFSTLSSVSALFSNRWLLLAGWVHYLAFDLFVGSWQVRDADKRGIPHLAVIPSLILTFLFGPLGLLLYFSIRLAFRRTLVLAVESD